MPTLAPAPPEPVYACSVCEAPLTVVEFSDGGRWTARGLAMHGRRKHKAVLCFEHYVAACRAAADGGTR